MAFKVKFTSAVTGDIDDLDVLIQGTLVPSPGNKVNITEDYVGHGDLIIIYQISGLSGTDYHIEYTCKTGSSAASDEANPSPIDGTIPENNFVRITVTIPV